MNSNRLIAAFFAAALAGCAGRAPEPDAPPGPVLPPAQQQTAAQGVRERPPAPLPPTPISFPSFEERRLANGTPVIIVEHHEQPVVTVSLQIKGGTAADPQGKPGVADLTADLLNKGTRTRSARRIAETIDFVGGSLSSSAGTDWITVSATSLTAHLDTALALLSDVVINPTFPQEELEVERTRVLTALQVQLSNPSALAERYFAREVYGRHPYGASITTESARALRRTDLVAFHRERFTPDNALVVVAGDVRTEDILARLNRYFRGWSGSAAADAAFPAPPARQQREVVLVHKPGSVQAVVRAGHTLPPATHADWVALDVGTMMLGGSFGGWLFQVLRDEKGYTYGAYASGEERVGHGLFKATAEVRNQVADSAMSEMFRLIERLRTGPIPAADFERTKSFMTGVFPLQVETPQQVASQVAQTRLLGRPHSFLQTYRDRVAATTAEEVQRAARTHIDPQRMVLVVVGDAVALREKLAAFGPVRLLDVEGRPLAASDLEVRAADVTFDAAKIQPHTLVYSISVQGNPIAELTNTVTRESAGGRDVIRATSRATGMLELDVEVVVDAATLAAVSSRRQQRAGPVTIRSDLRMEGSRVVGSATTPQGETRRVDAEVVPGTLLPGMDALVLQATDPAARAEYRLPQFSPLTGSTSTTTVRVRGETKVTVPAGTFDAYELEVSGEEGAVRVLVRKAAPHITLRQEYAAQPVVTELKQIK